jgi:hypothetical protein
VGRGYGVCFAVAGGWVGDRFDTGRDLLVSPGRNGARRRAVGLVFGICRHGGQYTQAASHRQSFLFFGILGGLSLFGAVGIVLGPALLALLRALLDLYSEEYSSIERP